MYSLQQVETSINCRKTPYLLVTNYLSWRAKIMLHHHHIHVPLLNAVTS